MRRAWTRVYSYRNEKLTWREFVGVLAVAVALLVMSGLLWWQISTSAKQVRVTGDLVSGTVIDVHDRRGIDYLDIEYRTTSGLEKQVKIVVWDIYDYDVGSDIDLYVDSEGSGTAVVADAFSTNAYWSAYLATYFAVGGGVFILIAVVRVIWDRLKKS